MKWGRVAAVVVFSCFFVLAVQASTQVHLKIQITDQAGAVIPGAQVKVYASSNSSVSVSSTADAVGSTALDLSPGTYTFTVAARVFQQYRNDHMVVGDGADQTVKIVLTVSPLPIDPVRYGSGLALRPDRLFWNSGKRKEPKQIGSILSGSGC
jgi:hypothetical protein